MKLMSRLSTPPWPKYSKEEVLAVGNVLRSGKVNYWTGHLTNEFETAFANWCQTKHAIAVSNGTVALELCLAGLKIGERYGGNADDEVIVTARSFIASASVVIQAGAVARFADVDANSQNITPTSIEAALTQKTKAGIVCVHLAGWPCDMDAIKFICQGKNIKIIEDCAQAHGAIYKGKSVGSLGDVAAWSFCQDKIISTGGEGGMVTCNDDKLWKRMWSYKDHGKNFDTVNTPNKKIGFRWLHENIGTNMRMTEMQSAIGLVQLRKMRNWTKVRKRNAEILYKTLSASAEHAIRIPFLKCDGCNKSCATNYCSHAWYRAYVFIRKDALHEEWSRNRILAELLEAGVPCSQGACPEIYLEKAFQNLSPCDIDRLPTAKLLGEESIAFSVHPTIDKKTMLSIAQITRDVIEKATKKKIADVR